MCGLVGFAFRRGADASWVRTAADRLVHRGPDDAGFMLDENRGVALAHRRLAILDLSAAGRQPLCDAAGETHVVFNGEIYNYRELRRELEGAGARFRTGTDTEVLLAAYRRWGAGCLARLEGMFAFAVYDALKRQLLLARDRAGEKPLFYRLDREGLRFASELKALLAEPGAPRTLDPAALEYYLAYGYVPAPHCLLAGYRKLRPGEAMVHELDTARTRTWQYWQLPAPARLSGDPGPLADELHGLLGRAVQRQLVADVPVGVLLSGGLDSSLITALAAAHSAEPVRTFTVTFPGHGRYDESRHARRVAQHFGTLHTELVAEPASAELLPALARQFDEPIADSSMVPTYLVSALIRQHAKVALGGDGGDELFGGYPHYSWMQWQATARRFMGPGLALGASLGRRLPLGARGRNHLLALGSSPRRSVAHINLFFDAAARARLRSAPRTARAVDESPERFKMSLWSDELSAAENAMRIDFLTYLPDDLLVKVDRASMLTSLEVRAPMLDPALIEFASALPQELRVHGRERKVLLRRLARDILPSGLDFRRKQGFSLPLDAWFRRQWGGFLSSVLRAAPPELFAHNVVEQLLEGQARGRSNMQRIFALAMLELWRREYRIDIEEPRPTGVRVAAS